MERLDAIILNNFYKEIFSIVLKIGIENLNIDFGEYTISFRPKNTDTYDFELVFWLNENRISFNIEDWYEVIDSYLNDEKEAFEVYEFIDTIFKNKVFIEEYRGRTNKTFKKNLVFVAKIDNQIQKISNPKNLHFKLPWIKTELFKVKEFKSLY